MKKSEENKIITSFMNQLPVGLGIYRVSQDGMIELLSLNDDFYQWTGYTRGEKPSYHGKSTIQAIHIDDQEKVQDVVALAIKRNQPMSAICRLLFKSNSYRWVSIRMKPMEKSTDGSLLYACYTDVNELVNTREMVRVAYEKVKESDSSMRTMLEHMPGAMVVFEVKNQMLHLRYISEGCVKISGFTAEETFQKHNQDPLADAHPDSRSFFLEHEWEDIQSKKTISYKYQILCKDGSYKWVNLSLSPVTIKGELLYYGVLRDLDVDEFEAIESHHHFEQMITNMNSTEATDLVAKARVNLSTNQVLYYVHRGHGGKKFVEERSFDEIVQAFLNSVIDSNTRQEMRIRMNRQSLIESFDGSSSIKSMEYQRVDTNGNTLWYNLQYALLKSPDDEDIIGFLYIYDITERILENHMMMKLGEEEYDVLGLINVKTHFFESKSVKGVKSLADDHNMYVKGQFEDVIHQQIQATVLKSEQKDLEVALTISNILSQLECESVYHVPFTAYRKDESYRRKKMNFCYLDESKTYIFYYCTDITEAYDREQAQLLLTERALEEARIANESKNEFVSRMSHDMRTPMNGILGIAALSEDEEDIDVLRSNIQKIKASGEYLLDLINDTLDFQRIESGKLRLEPEIVNCQDILTSIMIMLKPAIEKKHIDFRVFNKNVVLDWDIKVDPVRMRQIFINLVSNAIKFTPEGGIISVDYECMEREDMISHDRFIIRDTGIGMSKEFLEHKIFQPFAQERNEVTGQYAGSGLGLSIVKKLVDLMGGSISVESEIGVGTTFELCLDFERVNKDDADTSKSVSQQESADIIKHIKGQHILLVEDHPLNAEIAVKLLKKADCSVDWAKNGQEGVEAFASSSSGDYHLILMDVRMPVMDGLEATKMIRQLERVDARDIPIIAMTANAYEEDKKACIASGMNAHIAKPINPNILYKTIEQYLS